MKMSYFRKFGPNSEPIIHRIVDRIQGSSKLSTVQGTPHHRYCCTAASRAARGFTGHFWVTWLIGSTHVHINSYSLP